MVRPRVSALRLTCGAAGAVAWVVAGVWVLRQNVHGAGMARGMVYEAPTAFAAASALPLVAALAWLIPAKAWGRPLSRVATAALVFVACMAPAWLLSDSLATSRIYGDDFEYIGTSRTFPRALANLFTPHNVHIVPVWRIITATVLALAGDLAHSQQTLAATAYAILAATMLLLGRFVARETGRAAAGFAAMVVYGTTSLMWPAAWWFSASQATAAAFGILATLYYLQSWKRSGGAWRLAMACLATLAACWCWTVGLVGGVVGAVYVLADWRPNSGRRRWPVVAAGLVVLTSVAAAGLDLALAQKAIEEQAKVSFHGRSTNEAMNVAVGISHTIQAIPERLILGGLAVVADLEFQQAAMLLLAIVGAWAWTRRGARPTPLEAAGAAILIFGSVLEWSFRGYLPFNSLRGFVPWYDVIPYLGLVLFLVGWWAALRFPAAPASGNGDWLRVREGACPHFPRPAPLTRASALALVLLQLGLIVLHQPRADALLGTYLPPLLPSESAKFPIPPLLRARNLAVAANRAEWQLEHLHRLDDAQALARRHGVGRDALIAAYGRVIYPDPPYVYDADLLDLPLHGVRLDPARVHREFDRFFAPQEEPKPSWLGPGDPWPPKDAAIGVKRPDRGARAAKPDGG
ncbi:MAG TPA: hypothetical protein VG406_12110 [Isosphaeraceae bacterium]|jgi:hypothetical protein|nr:hypothetical protein [Isosphaeraceae bacterium]